MKKRLFGLALVLALCLTLLSVSALAADEPYNLWVNNIQVKDANATDVLGDADEGATVYYDAESNTLTLNGATLDTAYGSSGGDPGVIYYTGQKELTVKAEGSNTITSETATGIWSSSGGNICLAGAGSLTVETGGSAIAGAGVTIESGTYNLTSTGSNSIYAYQTDVTISGTANVTAAGRYGIVGSNVAISDNAKVDTTSTADCGIFTAGTVTISGNADVTANGNYAALRGDTKVEITGGTVEATSVDDCGIYSNGGDIDITGGTVKAVSENNTGIFPAAGNVIISGTADVTATSINEWAVYSNAVVSVSDTAKLTATTSASDPAHGYGAVRGNMVKISDNANVEAKARMYQAIVAYNGVSITGGNVYAEAEDTAIWGYNSAVSITGGTVTAVSSNSSAISAQTTLTISGEDTVVNATSNASGYSAIRSTDTLTISNGAQVTATGTQSSGVDGYGDIVISGTNTSVTASNGAENGAAIIGQGNIQITDGADVSASGAGSGIYTTSTESGDVVSISGSTVQVKLDSNQNGIYAANGITITGSWVDATEQHSNISISDSVLFEGATGQVYGDATVPGDVEVPEGKTLNIPANKTLVVPEGATLTNNGIITVAQQGAVTNDGTIVGDIQNAGTTTNNGIIQGAVTGEGTTNNGGIIQDGDSIQVSTKDAVQMMINTSVGKTEAVVITLMRDITGDLSIPIGANVVIDGGNQYKIAGKITCTTSTNAADVTNLTLKNLTMDGDADGDGTNDIDWAISSANQSTETVNALNLTLKNCTVKNYANKGMYLTNAKTLRVNSCTFENNATVEMNSPNSRGDYTIDLNLVAIQGADISITNTTFKGECGKKAVVKVVQRGANDGTGATDITGAMASIANFNLSGCTFADTTAEADVNLGTAKKDINATAENLTGNFPATISGNATAVVVRTPYLNTVDTDSDNTSKNTPTLTVPAGRTATKAANGVLTVKPIGSVTVTPTPTPEPEELPFTDVSENLWFYDYVAYVYANGLMDGTSGTTFEPDANMTRAMVWAILARVDGETVTGTNWLETARSWAMANGVSDGENANGYVTREQLATMLWRYAGEPTSAYSLSAYTDASSVSDYAETAMAWAVENGIITGMTDTTIEPQGTATRAQCAAMLMRFVEGEF